MIESELFDAAFLRRAPGMTVRPERPEDETFLLRLFVACTPLAEVLPPSLLELQAITQLASHRQAHPSAMRRIVLGGEVPVGRIMVDWNCDGSAYGVDIAVFPEARATHTGTHLLRAWIEVADRLNLPCTLEVFATNRARLLYRRLGFASTPDQNFSDPVVFMSRPALISDSD